MADEVAEQLREEGKSARTVTLKVRDENFKTLTRSRTLPAPTRLGEDILSAALDLFRERVDLAGRAVRLLGVGASGLEDAASPQMELFPEVRRDKRGRLTETVDEIRKKHGSGSVLRGTTMRKGKGGA